MPTRRAADVGGMRWSLPRRARGAFAFPRRHAMGLRVALALTVSLGSLVFASEFFFTRVADRELVQQVARGYVADAGALETAYREASDPADAIDDVLDFVDSMDDRLGVESATLLDARNRPVSAPRDAHLETREVGEVHRFLIPIKLGGKPFYLQVDENDGMLHSRISALSNEARIFSIVSTLIGLGLFYVLGGRNLARRHKLVVKRATRDSLTDLGNHRSFQDELALAVAVAARRREPLALALIDLDDFKFTNDRHGHRKGDEVLLDVARVLTSGRAEDRAFRIGGDEFA